MILPSTPRPQIERLLWRKIWTWVPLAFWSSCRFMELGTCRWGTILYDGTIISYLSGWWQLKYFWNFHLYLGKMNPFWRAYFSDGLVQPPTSLAFWAHFFFFRWTGGTGHQKKNTEKDHEKEGITCLHNMEWTLGGSLDNMEWNS